MYYNCIVAVNKTTYFISQGEENNNSSDARKTFFFDFARRTLTPGPQLNVSRTALSCSRLRNPATGTNNIIAVGGITPANGYPLDSTEILDVLTLIWRPGLIFTDIL
jgi:hypothetical protein